MADANGKIPIPWVFHIVGYLTAMLMAYGMARSDISALQADQKNTDQRLQRIEYKVDQLLERR